MQLAEADPPVSAGIEEVARRQLQWRDRSGKPLALFVVVLIWQAVGLVNQVVPFYNPLLFPAPWDLLVAGWKLARSGVLWWDIVASTSRVLIGTLFAAPIGIVLGIAVARIRWLEIGIEPIIELLRPVPTLALLPMIILWFGIGETSKILFIAYSCFFVIFTTTLIGVRNVDPILLHAGESLGFSRMQLYRYIILRAVLPDIMLGVRLGLSVGFLVIVAAEFIAADTGLGYLINYSRTWFRVADMLVGAIIIGLLGVTANYLLVALERRMFRWRIATT
jgi:ABC-type nitrate/sulfonate/bicarbonate transport system permease component